MVQRVDDSIQFWNPGAEAMYGWWGEEVLGKDLHSVLRTVFPVPREEINRPCVSTGGGKATLFRRRGTEPKSWWPAARA